MGKNRMNRDERLPQKTPCLKDVDKKFNESSKLMAKPIKSKTKKPKGLHVVMTLTLIGLLMLLAACVNPEEKEDEDLTPIIMCPELVQVDDFCFPHFEMSYKDRGHRVDFRKNLVAIERLPLDYSLEGRQLIPISSNLDPESVVLNIQGGFSYFKDEIFIAFVYEQLDVETGSQVLAGDLRLIRQMDLSGTGIEDLTGMEFFGNLERLDLSNNPELTAMDGVLPHVLSVDISNTSIRTIPDSFVRRAHFGEMTEFIAVNTQLDISDKDLHRSLNLVRDLETADLRGNRGKVSGSDLSYLGFGDGHRLIIAFNQLDLTNDDLFFFSTSENYRVGFNERLTIDGAKFITISEDFHKAFVAGMEYMRQVIGLSNDLSEEAKLNLILGYFAYQYGSIDESEGAAAFLDIFQGQTPTKEAAMALLFCVIDANGIDVIRLVDGSLQITLEDGTGFHLEDLNQIQFD